ncbi:hypothetical protein H0H92_002479 [Tricholoma furcatifolium]|nr:hypothetical protein H0H92_002479 [Tricholoma furcatifolium]
MTDPSESSKKWVFTELELISKFPPLFEAKLLPKSMVALQNNPPECIYSMGCNKIWRLQKGIVLKTSVTDLTNEVDAMNFAYRSLPGVPIPRVLHRPSINRRRQDSHRQMKNEQGYGSYGGTQSICMEECRGVSLEGVIDSMSEVELDHVAQQLSSFLRQMAHITSSRIGTVRGGPHRNWYFAE